MANYTLRSPYLSEPHSLATESDWAWLAGFLEGEAHFSMRNGGGVITASQVNPEPLVKVHAICGGRVSTQQRSGKSKDILVWRLGGDKARHVLRKIHPLMSAKRRRQIAPCLCEPVVSNTKTHCKHGHPLSGDNLYLWGTHRGCRACRSVAGRKHYERTKA